MVRGFEILSGYLDKAAAHAELKKIDPSILVKPRLYPDMLSLSGDLRRERWKDIRAGFDEIESFDVIPAAAGIREKPRRLPLDARFRGHDTSRFHMTGIRSRREGVAN
jgi:hypothetical protein